MGIYKVKDRRGRRRYVVSRYWPNGSGRLRRYAPNYRSAQALQTRTTYPFYRVQSSESGIPRLVNLSNTVSDNNADTVTSMF